MSKRALRKRLRTAGTISLVAVLNLLFPQHAQTLTASAATTHEDRPIFLTEAFPTAELSGTSVSQLPKAKDKPAKRVLRLTVTAYSSSVDETDSDPFTTASGAKVHDGMAAYNFLPFGTKVRFPEAYGDKVFVIGDRMNPRHGRFIADIWMPSKQAAKQWGARVLTMEIL